MTTMFDEYQSFYRELDSRFKIKGDPTLFACIGMAEEAGECLGKIKRVLRGEKFDHAAYIIELGDLLGYLAMAANSQDLSLEEMIAGQQIVSFGLNGRDATLHLHSKVSKTLDLVSSDLYHSFPENLAGILFWVYQCAYSVDSTIEAVISANELKMRDRIKNNTLLGTGDKR